MLHIPWQDAFCLPQTCQEVVFGMFSQTNKLSIKENYVRTFSKWETSSQNRISRLQILKKINFPRV